MDFRGHKKDEDEAFFPFQTDKMQAVQESKAAFNEPTLNAKKCVFMITKLLYILGQGDTLGSTSANDLFFGATKLFLSEDTKLRRMLYILLKELAPYSEQAFVAIASLSKDMSSKTEDFRANAIRALRKVTEQSMMAQLDRHLKQCVVDQSASVASAALVVGFNIADFNLPLVQRWTSEVQAALKTSHNMVQYHALAVLYKLRRTDPLAVSKLISSNISAFRSPLAHTLLVKYSVKILNEENSAVAERSKTILKYLDSCLTYKNDMIVLEAAKALCNLEYLAPKDLTPAVTALQTFLSSSRPVYKFAAIRILNKLANRFPILVSLANNEMDNLIHDSNRNIATLAITTLLKTGSETNIDKLMKQISGFMSEIPDEFKIVVVDAMRALCLQYPLKYTIMLTFLSNSLREEGGYEYKKAIVDTIITIIDKIPLAKEPGLNQLCEFIEDCEFTLLLQQVLHFLGNEGPKSQYASKCIRYIYNRVILESAPVRASAVIALAKFAAKVPALRPSVVVILRRTMQDNDDEVRDRAVFYLRILESGDEDLIKRMVIDELPVNISNLERTLVGYITANDFSKPFDINNVKAVVEKKPKENGEKMPSRKTETSTTTSSEPSQLQKMPELSKFGAPFKSSKFIALSEDVDYGVQCVKHIYKDRIVLQVSVTNKVETQKLRDVKLELDFSHITGLEETYRLIGKPSSLSFNTTETFFVVIERDPSVLPIGKISCVLKFVADTVDAESGDVEEEGEDEEEFSLEDLRFTVGDFLVDKQTSQFKESWDSLAETNESQANIKEPTKDNLQAVIDKFVAKLGLTPLNDKKVPARKTNHTLYFAGELATDDTVMIATKLEEDNGGVVLKFIVRSDSETARARTMEYLVQK